ncbi:hypothetical protein [Acaryochloris thomasi]|uniref:hypothetical protein n=1 Tax=Acaryochloris thomasi TaxID=2929456 RepID=UPI000DA65CB2
MLACLPVAIATPSFLPPSPVHASELSEIFVDPSIPATLQLKTLDETWKRLQLNEDTPGLSASMLFGISGLVRSALRTDVYYTQGKTVTIGKQKYLVAYRPESSNINFLELMQSGRNKSPEDIIEPLTPESPLTLSLFNLSTLSGLRDIQPFNLQKEIEASKKAIPEEPEKKPSTSEKPASAEDVPAPESLS